LNKIWNFIIDHFVTTRLVTDDTRTFRLKSVLLLITNDGPRYFNKQFLYLILFYRSSFKFQSRNYVTYSGHICNHSHGQENHTKKYI